MKKLTSDQGVSVVKYVRDYIKSQFDSDISPQNPDFDLMDEKRGVFVTLRKGDSLRGCIGLPYPDFKLKNALERAAEGAIDDPRFQRLRSDELDRVTIEVTILTEPKEIKFEDEKELKENIKLGKHGLIIKSGFKEGLLLPQVPIEQGWDVEQYLQNLCLKASLDINKWKENDVEISSFQGQIFSENTPGGKIVEE